MAVLHAHVTWTATSHGVDFAAYGIYRDGERVAEATDEATDEWDDGEAHQGVQQSYQIRVELTDGTFSLLSSAVNVTLTSSGSWWLTSNALPGTTFEVDAELPSYRLPEDRAVLELHSRDNAAVFHGLEDRGDEFVLQANVLVAAGAATTSKERVMYDALIAFVRNPDLPYVCVLSPWGRRWYAAVLVDQITPEQATAEWGYLPLQVREVASVPAVAVV